MPILLDPTTAPLPHQRQHGLVNASAADICEVILCVFLDLEEHLWESARKENPTLTREDCFILDRYDMGDGVLVPAVLVGNVPDDYTPKFQGVAITVLANPRVLGKFFSGQNAHAQARRWSFIIRDRSGKNYGDDVVVRVLKDMLFKDGIYLPDTLKTDAQVPTGTFQVDLYDTPESYRQNTLVFKA